MGACGCGVPAPQWRLPTIENAPEYAIEVHNGCKYCETPVGVILYEINQSNPMTKDWDTLPLLEFNECHESAIAVISPNALMTALKDESPESEYLLTTEDLSRILNRAQNLTRLEYHVF